MDQLRIWNSAERGSLAKSPPLICRELLVKRLDREVERGFERLLPALVVGTLEEILDVGFRAGLLDEPVNREPCDGVAATH